MIRRNLSSPHKTLHQWWMSSKQKKKFDLMCKVRKYIVVTIGVKSSHLNEIESLLLEVNETIESK